MFDFLPKHCTGIPTRHDESVLLFSYFLTPFTFGKFKILRQDLESSSSCRRVNSPPLNIRSLKFLSFVQNTWEITRTSQKSKRGYFLFAPAPYPTDRTTSNNSPHPGPKGWSRLGDGNRSNWTMHYMAVGSKTGQTKFCLSVPVRVRICCKESFCLRAGWTGMVDVQWDT